MVTVLGLGDMVETVTRESSVRWAVGVAVTGKSAVLGTVGVCCVGCWLVGVGANGKIVSSNAMSRV